MKKLWFFLFIILISQTLIAQYVFVVSETDSSDKKNCNMVFYGELLSCDKIRISEFNEFDPQGECQLHIISGMHTISFLADRKFSFDKFNFAPEETYYPPPFKQQIIMGLDIITEGTVLEMDMSKGKIFRSKIKKGMLVIRYELNPKKMTVFFSGLKIRPERKKFFIKI